jgi:electron transport complex protein RnfG
VSDHEAPPARPAGEAAAWRLTTTLALAGAIAGVLIVVVHQWAEPRVEAYRTRVLQEAILEVLHDPARFDTLYVGDGALSEAPPAGRELDPVYVGYDASDRPMGFAIPGEGPGFQDVVRLIFGYDPATGEVLGMRVLESKETPGLGDKIIKDAAFVSEFEGVSTPLLGVKPGAGEGEAAEVDMITGATISSRAVIGIINRRVEALGPAMAAWRPAEDPPAGPEARR